MTPTHDLPASDFDQIFNHPLIEHHQSSLSTFQMCPQRYVFRYLMRLVPRRTDIPLIIGTAVHAGTATLIRPATIKQAVTPNKRLTAALRAVDNVFDEALEDPEVVLAPEELDALNYARCQAVACVRAWWIYHTSNGFPWTKVFEVEQPFHAMKSATLASALDTRMGGRRDSIVLVADHQSKKHRMVHELKTRSNLQNMDFVRTLDIDHQACWYALAAARDQLDVDGLIYTIIVKPLHRTGEGEELIDRMINAMIAEPARYFVSIPVFFSQRSLNRMRVNYERIIHRIDVLEPDNIEMNGQGCTQYSGCPYQTLCCAGADAGRPAEVISMHQSTAFRVIPPEENIYGD